MKKIFITGGSGNLGQKLVEYLSIDNEVYAPNKDECDILDIGSLKEKIKPNKHQKLTSNINTN